MGSRITLDFEALEGTLSRYHKLTGRSLTNDFHLMEEDTSGTLRSHGFNHDRGGPRDRRVFLYKGVAVSAYGPNQEGRGAEEPDFILYACAESTQAKFEALQKEKDRTAKDPGSWKDLLEKW